MLVGGINVLNVGNDEHQLFLEAQGHAPLAKDYERKFRQNSDQRMIDQQVPILVPT